MHEPGEGMQPVLATSRSLALRPAEAKAALAACAGSEIRLDLPAGARAVLRDKELRGPSAGDRGVLAGSIRSRRGWVAVPVEVETLPVSDASTELVVRPVGPVCLRSSSHRRLFDSSSHALAEFFRMEIELAGLAATTPRHPVRAFPPSDARVSLPA